MTTRKKVKMEGFFSHVIVFFYRLKFECNLRVIT